MLNQMRRKLAASCSETAEGYEPIPDPLKGIEHLWTRKRYISLLLRPIRRIDVRFNDCWN